MSRNIIEEIGNYYKMFDGFSLQSLDLGFNRISYLDQQMLVESLEEINLEGNNIT
jgi:Leucine-rich repeat (LRR) protein